jgi:hypothetical protein
MEGASPIFFNPRSAPAMPVQTWGTRPEPETMIGRLELGAVHIFLGMGTAFVQALSSSASSMLDSETKSPRA